mgnify:CR=1 FL=1
MAFTWQQGVEVGNSIDAADLNEIKTNIDSIYSYLGTTYPGCASGAGWSSIWPIQGGGTVPILASHFLELRSKVDYVYDNWCRTHYNGHKSGYYSVYDSPDYAWYDSTVKSAYCSSVQSSNNASVCSYNNTLVYD